MRCRRKEFDRENLGGVLEGWIGMFQRPEFVNSVRCHSVIGANLRLALHGTGQS